MARRLRSSPQPSGRPGRGRAEVDDIEDEMAVRAYLRALIGSPVRMTDRPATTESRFIERAGRWAQRRYVDRRELSLIGVDRRILDAAGILSTPAADLVRRCYTTKPQSITDLVRHSGVSSSSVRQTIQTDLSCGVLESAGKSGRSTLYRLVS